MTVGMPEVHQAGVVSARFASGQLCAVWCSVGMVFLITFRFARTAITG